MIRYMISSRKIVTKEVPFYINEYVFFISLKNSYLNVKPQVKGSRNCSVLIKEKRRSEIVKINKQTKTKTFNSKFKSY